MREFFPDLEIVSSEDTQINPGKGICVSLTQQA